MVHAMLQSLSHAFESPARSPRMAVVIGRLLGLAFVVCMVTGLYSHFLQEPLPWMVFPTRPIWLYQVSQGMHITAGILCFPLLLGKLYAVQGRLFETPPVRSVPHFLERSSIALLVAASLVQLVIGLLNTYQWYALFPFPFRQTHFALSFVIIGALAIHIGVKLPVIARNWTRAAAEDPRPEELAERASRRAPHADAGALRDAGSAGSSGRLITPRPEEGAERPSRRTAPADTPRIAVGGVTGRVLRWIDSSPRQASPRTSRRGFLAAVGVTGAAVVALTAGQSFRSLDALNVFGPRKQGIGPQALPVNRTAAAAKVEQAATSTAWRLVVTGPDGRRSFTRAELEQMPLTEVVLPIACVEGWSQYATWRGVRVKELAALVGGGAAASVVFVSLEQDSSYARTEMGPEFAGDDLSLVALELNGGPLDLDHGYPARVIAPARPGVLQTKWLSSMEVSA
jgi:hypothetical protein